MDTNLKDIMNDLKEYKPKDYNGLYIVAAFMIIIIIATALYFRSDEKKHETVYTRQFAFLNKEIKDTKSLLKQVQAENTELRQELELLKKSLHKAENITNTELSEITPYPDIDPDQITFSKAADIKYIKKNRPYLYKHLGKEIDIKDFINNYFNKLRVDDKIFIDGELSKSVEQVSKSSLKRFDIIKTKIGYGVYVGGGIAAINLENKITAITIDNITDIKVYRVLDNDYYQLYNRAKKLLDRDIRVTHLSPVLVVENISKLLREHKHMVNAITVAKVLDQYLAK